MSTIDINGQVWLGSERVDKAPLTAGTTGDDTTDGYALEMVKQLVERTIADNLPRITDGFRVEIPTQSTSPGDFAIHNGVAFDRWGRAVESTSDQDSSKTVNLPLANTTYFVEVELTRTAAYPDARAFWNPETDNGNDPSGDIRPPGQEYRRNVSTQWVPDWTIPQPSTVGFAYTATSPNSIRIPVAILTTDNSVPPRITAGSVVARTVLRQGMAIGSTVARCVSTRLFPDTGAITINGVAATIVSNDRENNVLNIAAGVAAAKDVGARVIDTVVGGPLFLAERYGATLPLPLTATTGPFPTATQQDCRPRMYQPNEALGMAYLQDPYAASGVSDVQIASLKAELDAFGAKLRDITAGGMLNNDPSAPNDFAVGQFAPATFEAIPRWYHRTGSIPGAKACTVSIGDGVLSYGDYNMNAYASVQACVQAALDKIAESTATSGVLYIKRGAAPYDPTATINVAAMTKRLVIVGEGHMTEFRATGAFPVFTIASNALVYFKNMKISRNGGTGEALSFGAVGGLTAEDCDFDVVLCSGVLGIRAYRCVFRATGGSSGIALRGLLTGEVHASTLTSTVNANTSYAVRANTTSAAKFYDCSISTTGVAMIGAVYQDTSATLTFDGCTFSNASTPAVGWAAIYVPGGSTGLNITRSSLTGVGGAYGLVNATNLTRAYVANCPSVTFGPNLYALSLVGATASKSYTVRDCTFTQASTSGAKAGYGVWMEDVDGVLVDNVRFTNCDNGIYFAGTDARNVTVRHAIITNATATAGKLGIRFNVTNATHITIDDCEISGLDDSSVADVAGVWLECDAGAAVSVTKCSIFSLGSAACANVYGVRTVGGIGGVTVDGNRFALLMSLAATKCVAIEDDATNGATEIGVDGNKFLEINGVGAVYAIDVPVYKELTITRNKMREIGTDTDTTGEAIGIRWGTNTNVTPGDSDQEGCTVSENIINTVTTDGTADAFAIYGAVGVGRATIANNSIADVMRGGAGATGGYGIVLDTQLVTPGPYIRNITLTGNILGSTAPASFYYAAGIQIEGLRSATDTEGQIIINGNNVGQFSVYGIVVSAAAGQSTNDVTISNNIVKTDIAGTLTGIYLPDCTGFNICGNNVSMSAATQNQYGIHVGSGTAAQGVIGSNRVYVNQPNTGPDFYGISATGADINVGSNYVYTFNARGIYISGARSFAAANALSTNGGGIGILAAGGAVTAVAAVTNINIGS